MKIRHKLLVLLLLVSLVPVLITVVLTRLSIKRLSAQISRDIQAKQFQDVVEGVTVHVPPDIDEAQLTRLIRAIRVASR